MRIENGTTVVQPQPSRRWRHPAGPVVTVPAGAIDEEALQRSGYELDAVSHGDPGDECDCPEHQR